jgi:molybdate/tungstate transport system substrate-binding protein
MGRRKGIILAFILATAGAAWAGEELSGTLTVFHAGSLSVPFKQIAADFHRRHPRIEIRLEAAGSRDSARKISDLGRAGDVMASADYQVIDQLLIPQHADWNLKFATNEMAIVYHAKSRHAKDIDARNWYEILMKPDVVFGRANPNADPCGYRSLMTMQLAERHYGKPGLAQVMAQKDRNYIRPKEVDLLALLESNSLDYIFLYRSVAEQHGLSYVRLPDAINLRNPAMAAEYRTAKVPLSGKKPGEIIQQFGAPMVYGVTIPKRAPNPRAALAFVRYLVEKSEGMKVIENAGQPSAIPSVCDQWEKLPKELRPFALKRK